MFALQMNKEAPDKLDIFAIRVFPLDLLGEKMISRLNKLNEVLK